MLSIRFSKDVELEVTSPSSSVAEESPRCSWVELPEAVSRSVTAAVTALASLDLGCLGCHEFEILTGTVYKMLKINLGYCFEANRVHYNIDLSPGLTPQMPWRRVNIFELIDLTKLRMMHQNQRNELHEFTCCTYETVKVGIKSLRNSKGQGQRPPLRILVPKLSLRTA